MKLIKSTIGVLIACCILIGAIWGAYELFPLKYLNDIRTVSASNGVDKYLVAALIKAESNFKCDAVSSAGAKGVMQLTDDTARFCAEKIGMNFESEDIYNPKVNIQLGVYYLSRTLSIFNGDESLAVAAYNAGEGRVRKWLEDPEYSTDGTTLDTIPYHETKRHVEKIKAYKKIYKLLYPNL